MRWFSGPSVRNMATIGGNIVTASPISDLIPVFICMDAKFVLKSKARGERQVSARDFFVSFRQTLLQPDEVLVDVIIDYNKVLWSSYFF
jgi:xanthine dehydrogenase/oxidase